MEFSASQEVSGAVGMAVMGMAVMGMAVMGMAVTGRCWGGGWARRG